MTQVAMSSWGMRYIDNDNDKELNIPKQYMPMSTLR